MYISVKEACKLRRGQSVICRCPNWNNEGFQVAEWNGEEFEYDNQPNDMFHENVLAFMPIDEDGEPYPEDFDGYFKNEFRQNL